MRARFSNQIRQQLRGDRHARAIFAILARIDVIRNHRRDAPRRRAPQRIEHNQQLHEIAVHRRARRLDDEAVLAAHVFEYLKIELAIGEPPDVRLAQLDAQVIADLFGEPLVGIAGKDFDIAVRVRRTIRGVHDPSTKKVYRVYRVLSLSSLTSLPDQTQDSADSRLGRLFLAEEGGFEPQNGGTKSRRLTAWRLPSIDAESIKLSNLVETTYRYAHYVQ